jgi:hypothetical protein
VISPCTLHDGLNGGGEHCGAIGRGEKMAMQDAIDSTNQGGQNQNDAANFECQRPTRIIIYNFYAISLSLSSKFFNFPDTESGGYSPLPPLCLCGRYLYGVFSIAMHCSSLESSITHDWSE